MARIEGTIARRESEHKSERITRKHRQLAEEGKPVAGDRRPFGYEWVTKLYGNRSKRVGLKQVPREVRLVEDAAKRVLGREPVLNRQRLGCQGRVDRRPGWWNTKTLKQILTSGRVAGWRDVRGEPVTRSEQRDPILDQDTWNRVRAILNDPARKRTRVAQRYLLGQGVLRCGECGGQLVAAPQRNSRNERVPRYGCRKARGGCGKVSALAEPIERIVSDAVIQRLSDPAFVARLNGADGGDDDTFKRERSPRSRRRSNSWRRTSTWRSC